MTLAPPADQNSFNYFLYVLPPTKVQGTCWETHKALVKSFIAQAQWTGGEPASVANPDGPGIFIKTEAAGKAASGEGRQFTLFTAAHDGVMELVLGVNGIDRRLVDPMLKATRLKDGSKAPERPKIVEAYRRMNQRLYATRDGGPLAAGSLQYERIWLRSDGTADFSTTYVEGYAASLVPQKTDPGLLSGDYGSWKAVGDKVQLLRAEGGAVELCERTKKGLRAGGQEWEAMPRVDGLKLSGRWELKSPPEEKVTPYHIWIDFTPEGRFRTDGAPRHASSVDSEGRSCPEKGAGTYEIRDWTMFFKFDDGTPWSIDFSTLGQEITPDASIIFRTFVFPKAR